MDECVWVNMHRMTGINSVDTVLELRCDSGYGMRWVLRGEAPAERPHNSAESSVTFRGCLEPAMAGGHEVGWHH